MEAEDAERKLAQHALEQRFQVQLADTWRGPGDLPLCDIIDGVDVVDAVCLGRVALMHRIEAQMAGRGVGLRRSPMAAVVGRVLV